jgi:hypothetical protein
MDISIRNSNRSRKEQPNRLKTQSSFEPTLNDDQDSLFNNDTLLAVALAKGSICLMSFNMTTQHTPVES